LKKEIARVARKELKGEIGSLRKAVTTHRSEIAALKRDVKSLLSENKRMLKLVAKAPSQERAEAAEDAPQRGRRAKFTAEGLLALRQRLGLTQAQMAKVVGVSSLSIYKWESGQVVPRQSQQARVLELRNLGKRAVAKMLEE
jgi:DNA-binding transcriptional regulator YiaG